MSKKLIAATLFLAACGSKSAPAPTAPAPTSGDPASTAGAPAEPDTSPAPMKAGRPELGTWGFDTKGMNAKVTPGTSFYQYANGGWLETT
ncbi:MAG: hypothetical protein JNL83_16855, partial [Myxococcales bacterium]|nr:hypothetical protein [Myxococcales bacterium]